MRGAFQLSIFLRAGCRGTIVYLRTTEREKRAITRIALCEHAPRIWALSLRARTDAWR